MYKSASGQEMPILCSIFPYKSTTFGMSKSAKEFIVNEIQRAHLIVSMIKHKEKLKELG